MQLARSRISRDPRSFGRGPNRHWPAVQSRLALGDDLRLFATTFIVGFLFVSVLLA
jgi:hypothetical protein